MLDRGIFRFKFCLPLVGQGCAEQLCRWARSDCLLKKSTIWRLEGVALSKTLYRGLDLT